MEQSIKAEIEKYSAMLPVGKSISYTEAERRAGEFLKAQALITDIRHRLGEAKVKNMSEQSIVYAEQLGKCTGKTVTENKVSVEASGEYVKAREDLENIDNDLSYLRAFYEIFGNAHIYYRNMAKGETA